MNLADSYVREGQKDDAVEAFAEAGARYGRQGKHEEAIRALMKGYDIHATDLRVLNGLVKAQTALGRAPKAASLLEEILDSEPYNRDVLYLLIECCIDSQNAAAAEKAVIKLVEIEPANYPKFLDLIRIYLNVNDPESAARILTMCSEYLLAGGQADECGKWINEILERDAAQLSGLRLLVRYNSWLSDENGFRLGLERLYNAARQSGSVEDERFALAQLVVIRPHETRYRDRLNEINAEYGYEDCAVDEELLMGQFAVSPEPQDEYAEAGMVERNGEVVEAKVVDHEMDGEDGGVPALSASDEMKVQKEIDSITFYIENDYNDLAAKALAELAKEYGDRPEFAELRSRIGAELTEEKPKVTTVKAEVEPEPEPVEVVEVVGVVETEMERAVEAEAKTNNEPDIEAEVKPEIEPVVANTIGINEIRSEFGIEGSEESESIDVGDYDTHYHTAVAYLEMGLTEQAISEFQDAISLSEPTDGTRNFFQCSNLLGHCFMRNGMANHAVLWFKRALDTPGISVEEHHGLWYELALAHEANHEDDEAVKYLEKIYAENVDFRDVSERVRSLVINH